MQRPRRVAGEEGLTLTELTVTVFLMGIVSLVLLTTLQTIVKTSASTDRKTLTTAEARLAVERIARDMRAANPIDAISAAVPTSTYDKELSFKVFCSTGANCVGGLRQVKYTVSGNTLTQTVGAGTPTQLLGPTDHPHLPATLRRGAIVNPATQPVFTYFDKHGAQIATNPIAGDGQPPSRFRDCTKRVVIHLVVRADVNNPSSTIDYLTSVQLRNYNEVNPC